VEHIAGMEHMRNVVGILVEKPEGRGHVGDIWIDSRILLKYIKINGI
jgi:hypothetical protein